MYRMGRRRRFRDSKRMWMAEDWGMGESWSLLSSWVTLCHNLHFCASFWRKGIINPNPLRPFKYHFGFHTLNIVISQS